MKKARCLMASIITAIFIFSAVPVQSQGFIAGVFAGAILFGDGNKTGTSASASIIYTLPDVSERVKNPLEIRMVSFGGNFIKTATPGIKVYNGRMSLQEIFAMTVENPKDYEILQIVRVFGEAGMAGIWFCYIEKNKVLPPLKKE